MSKQKRCPHCGETDITKFGTDRSRKDGLSLFCKLCRNSKQRESTATHRDEYNAYFRDYRRNHPKPKQEKSKVCPTCGETDPAMFASDASRKNNISVYCLTCKRAQSNAWYAAHKSIVSQRRKARRKQNNNL